MADPNAPIADSDAIVNAAKYADPAFGGVGSAPATAPGAAPSPQGSPAVWTLLGEAKPSMPRSLLAVGSTIYNRQQRGGYSSPDDVVKDPYNGYEAWQTPGTRASLQKQYPVGSPAYNTAEGVLAGLGSGQTKALPYDTYYNPTLQAQDKRPKPSFDDGSGDASIGDGNLYFSGKWSPPKMTPEQQSVADAVLKSTGSAGSGGANPPGTLWQAATPEQRATMLARRDAGLFDFTQESGTDANPWVEKLRKDGSGTAEPLPAGAYVDLQGGFHPGPRSTVQLVQNALAGFGQGTSWDAGASGAKFGLGGGDPLGAAYSQTQGGPSAEAFRQAALQGFGQEQQRYALEHAGQPEAQLGRAVGQGTVATVASIAIPEGAGAGALEALGIRNAPTLARLATNAFRGTAAAGTNVGANPNTPVSEQLAAGAAGGAILPEVAKAGGDTLAWLRGITTAGKSAVAPETLALAKTAIDDFGIPIRGSQITGTVDRNTAVRDSNLIASNPAFAKNNTAQVDAWNAALTKRTGADATFRAPTPTAIDSAKANTGAIYGDLSSKYNIRDGNGVVARLQNLVEDAKGAIPAGDLTPLENQIERVRSLIQPDGSITGAGYHGLTDTGTSLDALAGSSGPLSGYARQFRDVLDSAFREGMTPADQARLDQANSQWKTIKTIEPLEAKAGANGQISPRALQGRMAANKYTRGMLTTGATADDPLVQLARIGSTLMKEPNQSGTAPRLADTIKRTFGPAALTGGAIEAMHDPGTALKLLAGAAAAKGISMGANAVTNYRLGPSAGSALAGAGSAAPGAFAAGLSRATKPIQVPLSALMGVRLSTANAQ